MFSWLKFFQPHTAQALQTVVNDAEATSATPSKLSDESIAHKKLGDQYFEEDKLEKAIASYQRAIEINPEFAEVFNNLANVFSAQGLYTASENNLKHAILIKPDLANAYCNLGSLLLKKGRTEEAIENLYKALDLKPDVEIIYRDLGYALFQAGRIDTAKQIIAKGILLNTNFADFHFFLGNMHLHENELDQAVVCYQRALSIQPDYVAVLSNIGQIFQKQGKVQEAAACYREIIAIKPDFAEAHHNLGNTLNEQGKLDEAIASYKMALSFKPYLAYTHLHMGNIYKMQGRLSEALISYSKAVAIKPDYADAYYSLGVIFIMQRNIDEALKHLQKALNIDPKHNTARAIVLHQLQHKCEWEKLESGTLSLRHAVSQPQIAEQNKIDPFIFLSLPGTTAAEHKNCSEKLALRVLRSLIPHHDKPFFNHNRTKNQKIHIGYLSADFRQHPISLLMTEVIELHDRSHFSITAYSFGSDDYSVTRKRLEGSFDNFVDIQNDSFEDAAKKIYADHIDILIDLTGYTHNSRSAILALRPAPIQVNYLGYPGSMGANFVDYLIADQFVIPADARKHYTEKVVWMPDCFMPNDRTRPRLAAPSHKDCGLPEDGFVFCCFNQTYKITPRIFDIWCRLLKAVPDSVLWLPASNDQAEANLKREAENRGVAMERIVMASKIPKIEDHLARLQCADLFLDTIPYNAHATCSDALWMGLPVLTCVGETFPSRVAGSLLTALGVPELITYNLEDYYQLALDLATNRDKLKSIRNKIIANRDTSPLFDSERFTRYLEQAFMDMEICNKTISKEA